MVSPYCWMPEEGQRAWDEAEQQVRRERAQETPRVNLSALTAPEKRAVWQHLQRHSPELAATLQDPHVQAIREQFDAQIMIPADQLPPGFRS